MKSDSFNTTLSVNSARIHTILNAIDYCVTFLIIKPSKRRSAGHVAPMSENRNTYRILVGKPEGKRPLGRQRRRWKENIKIDLTEIG
jgi:hypothetical protein